MLTWIASLKKFINIWEDIVPWHTRPREGMQMFYRNKILMGSIVLMISLTGWMIIKVRIRIELRNWGVVETCQLIL